MSSMQKCCHVIAASSRERVARQVVARSIYVTPGTGVGTTATNIQRSSIHTAKKVGDVAAAGTSSAAEEHQLSQQAMLHDAGNRQEWGLPPLARMQNAVVRFRQKNCIDELPSRAQKSIAQAAEAGKGYVTPEDITRVMTNITEGKDVLTIDEAGEICEVWGEKKTGAETITSPSISADTFLRLLKPPSK